MAATSCPSSPTSPALKTLTRPSPRSSRKTATTITARILDLVMRTRKQWKNNNSLRCWGTRAANAVTPLKEWTRPTQPLWSALYPSWPAVVLVDPSSSSKVLSRTLLQRIIRQISLQPSSKPAARTSRSKSTSRALSAVAAANSQNHLVCFSPNSPAL